MMRRLLTLGLLLPALAAAEEELPVYPGAVHTRIGDDLLIAGEHYRIAWFTTRDPLPQVADFFFQQWRQKGYPTLVDGDLVSEGVVSAFYTRQGLQRAVVLRTHRGLTVGFAVLKDLWTRAAPPDGGGEPAPLEGTLFSQDMVAREDGGAAWYHSALLESDVPAAREHVEAQLAGKGYRKVREQADGEGGASRLWLEHARKGERVLTALAQLAPGLVAVLQTRTGEGTRAMAPAGQTP